MKKGLLFVLPMLFCTMSMFSQTLLTESFNFPVRDSLDGINGWSLAGANSANNIKVASPGLTYTGYTVINSGNKILMTNAANTDICAKSFTKRDSGSVYLSYLMKVDNLSPTAASGYNITLDQSGGATNHCLHCIVQRKTDTTFTLGVEKVSGVSYVNKIFNVKTTYLIVLKYVFVSGSTNDSAKVFVYSNGIPKTEPAVPDTFLVAGIDAVDVGEVVVINRQTLNGSGVNIDEIRIGTTWESVLFGAQDVKLSSISMNEISSAQLAANVSFKANLDSTSVVHPGTILLYKTNSGRFGKMRVLANNSDGTLAIRFTTLDLNGEIFSKADSLIVSNSGKVELDSAKLTLSDSSADIQWNVPSNVTRNLISKNSAKCSLYDPSFDGVSVADIQKKALSADTISANNDPTNLLTTGKIVFYKTNQGNYGKFKVLLYSGNTLSIKMITLAKNGSTIAMGDSVAIPGTWFCDLDSARKTSDVTAADFKWNIQTVTERNLLPKNNALFGLQTITEVVDKKLTPPKEFSLSQNYPNPFNPSTTISYQLSARSAVSLKVYDILGKEVATLVNETNDAGTYSVKFDASKLSSGMYFYILKARNFSATKILLVLK